MSSFADRIGGAIKLSPSLYEEVEHDENALHQAMAVVMLSSVAAGLGAGAVLGLRGFFWAILSAFVGWYFWAVVVYFVGTRILGTPNTRTDMGELLRVIGFASAPGIFRIFGVFTSIQSIVFVVAAIWMLIAMVIAVRQALDYLSTGRAIAVCIVGWLSQYFLILVLARFIQLFYTTA